MEETKKKPRRQKQPKVVEPEVTKEAAPVEAPSTSYHDAVVTVNALNLRVGPSKNEKVLMVLKKGQHVIVDEGFVSNLWSFVKVAVDFGEVSGYVMTQFIK